MPENFNEYYKIDTKEKKTGKLKIFFGYAAGVGKTYAMLQAAHDAKDRGIDVVVGYIEPHTRPDTIALLDGLEKLDEKVVEYKGIKLKEFDLDAALQRYPQIILVDELAHSNAKGLRHNKRYQDVEELLRAGINVYTTVNVQHIESLNDLVASITHVSVNERIPDYVFDLADKVELVDIEPQDLIVRLNAGKIYKKNKVDQALNNFFTEDKLEALRQIAIRLIADKLSKKAQKEENKTTLKATEHVLVCLSPSASNPKVIRTATRMVDAFHGSFTALFVETSETKGLDSESIKKLRENMHLAEQLGAKIVTVYGEDIPKQISEYTKISGITKIVIGMSEQKTPFSISSKSLIDRLTNFLDDVDIYIIPDINSKNIKKKIRKRIREKFSWSDLLKTFLILMVATVISFIFYEWKLSESNIIIVYLISVLVTAIVTEGYIYGVLVSIFSVIVFNFFFTIPRFSLMAFDVNYPVTFSIMLLSSVISSTLAARVKIQARESAQRAYYTSVLMSSNKRLQQGQSDDQIIEIAVEQIKTILKRPILYSLVKKDHKFEFRVYPKELTENIMNDMNQEEMGVAYWVAKNDKHAGATTNTLSHAQNLYLSVRGNQEVMAIVGIPFTNYPQLETIEKNLMIAILDECGLVLERKKLQIEKQNVEIEKQREQLRANLLRAISHDFRTPLTSISGNAAVLMEKTISLTEEKKNEIYYSIYDDSMWLQNLTENLLAITKIDKDKMQIKMNAELISEVFDEAILHVDRKISEHHLEVKLYDDMLMAKMDAHLIIQVIINIINNAVKYTPKGSTIILSAERINDDVLIKISDNGYGLSDESKAHIFDMFYTSSVIDKSADSRRGLGLGLSLCKSIVEAHGGQIFVRDNTPSGAIFSFTLPLEEVEINYV